MTLSRRSLKTFMVAHAAALVLPAWAAAQPILNEIYFDPPAGPGDIHQEYFEILAQPGEVLGNIFLLQIENENNEFGTGSQGNVDLGFDLTGVTVGSNGKLVIAQANNGVARPQHDFDPHAALLQGSTPARGFFGTPGLLEGSGNPFLPAVQTENSGGTYLLIDIGSGPAPVAQADLDADDDGTLDLASEWTVLDSVGLLGETGENLYGGVYGQVNFIAGSTSGPATLGPDLDISGDVVFTDFELEYFARNGDGGEWFVANLTDDPDNPGPDVPVIGANYVISAADVNGGSQNGDPEVSIDLPYGLSPLTPGGANLSKLEGFIDGDYNGDGFVSQADLDLVLLNWGDGDVPAAWLAAGQFDGIQVSQNELDGVLLNWGDGTPPETSALIPEPATAAALLAGGALMIVRRRTGI